MGLVCKRELANDQVVGFVSTRTPTARELATTSPYAGFMHTYICTLHTCVCIRVHTRVTHHAIRREVKNGRIAQTSGNCDTHCTYSARHILQHTLQRTLQRTTLPYQALLTHEGTSIHCATCTATHPATLPATQNDSLPDRVGVKKGRVSSGFWMVMSTE